ncbi:GNAT family N-acetyltransferase [Kribbella sp.]|uniref:GNAT family N-acetyltransferase n=1 Tax=Kribbella sp. TaxID=1871183 RepID=UPI002D286A3F|nr:GNAT family N-acetyltransferase [Kribbella sp.]HZX07466.1 GNAT family N-acetyltransferase [Kribbella sp.]
MTDERGSDDHQVTVRQAVEEDDAVLLAIERVAWDASSGFPSYGETLQDTFFTRSGPDAHLVAEYDGVVVGYVRLQEKYPFPEGSGVLAINGIAVAPDARRLGVGNALMTATTDEAHRRGARKITLHVHGVNAPARHLYERHGYVVEGTHTAEFIIEGAPVDALDMAKFL